MKNIINNREQLSNFANLYTTYGEQPMVYEPNKVTFQILRKYREQHETRTTGLKTLFDVAIVDADGVRKEYFGKPASFFGKLISGEVKPSGRTRAKKEMTPTEKVQALKDEVAKLAERQREIAELVGTDKKGKLTWSAYQARLEAEEVAKKAQKATAELTLEELLAEVARRQAEQE